jgi:hypothetical protein
MPVRQRSPWRDTVTPQGGLGRLSDVGDTAVNRMEDDDELEPRTRSRLPR